MQYQPHALFAQLQAAQTIAAQQAIFAQTSGVALEARQLHPGVTVGDQIARTGYEMSHWQAFAASIASRETQVVFACEYMGQSGFYGAITQEAFTPEWGTVVAAYGCGIRFDEARLVHLKFEIADAHAAAVAARYVDANPDEAELHRHLQCELFELAGQKGLDRTDRQGRLRAAFAICGRYVASWTQLTPSEMVKLIRAVAAGALAPGWIYNPGACGH